VLDSGCRFRLAARPSNNMGNNKDLPARAGQRSGRDLLRRTILRLLLTYVAPFVLLTAYFLVQSSRLNRESRRAHLASIAEHQAHILDLFLRERVVNLNNLINSPSMGVAPCLELADAFLAELKKSSDAFVDIGFFDESGVQTCYSGPFPSLQRRDYSMEQWFTSLRGNPGSHIITDSYLGFRGRPHFTIGVLRATLDPESIYQYIVRAIGASDVLVSIINADGYFQIVTPHIGSSLDESSIMPPREPRTGAERVAANGRKHEVGYSWLQTADWALITQLRMANGGGLPESGLRNVAVIASVIILVITVIIVFRARSLVRIQEETAETRKQLVHASKLASVGELAAGIAHEINNPLGVISEEAGLMKDMMDPTYGKNLSEDQIRESLDEIRKAVFRCRDITRKLLAFVRSEGFKLESHGLNSIVNEVLDGFLTRGMASSNITVERKLNEGLPPLITDAVQFEQVFVNIINNAVDAMQGGPGTIIVETSQDEKYQHVAVSDTGCGMDEETMARVFQPFFTTKEVGKGTGLGLSVSFGIVESLGGKISVESALGQGSTFKISLPKQGV
jgi:two-component system NtrC family sensor kinase